MYMVPPRGVSSAPHLRCHNSPKMLRHGNCEVTVAAVELQAVPWGAPDNFRSPGHHFLANLAVGLRERSLWLHLSVCPAVHQLPFHHKVMIHHDLTALAAADHVHLFCTWKILKSLPAAQNTVACLWL
jgi:hypothetical protein